MNNRVIIIVVVVVVVVVITIYVVRQVVSPAQVSDLMAQGQANRAVGAHDMNEHSSRSHSILTIVCRGKNKIDNTSTVGTVTHHLHPLMVECLNESINDVLCDASCVVVVVVAIVVVVVVVMFITSLR